MTTGPIELTEEESEIVRNIEFDQEVVFRQSTGAENGFLSHKLMMRLIERKAIPEERVKYFTDGEYSHGTRGRSRMKVFERNGTSGEDIFRHGNFLKHLRYFIYGCDLKAAVVNAFSEKIRSCGNFTSGDIEPLRKYARELTRHYGLNPHDAAEEFYKLSIDCGIGPHYARSVYDAVKQVR
ncbi:hypothetical protein [Magnetospirillum sp. 15-1]|uniref:hypothetical protein n=1 Tax=Magnetospirillum sp. 15-1 TaxID=1979370 RepID=UPI000BBCA520|nr:hypothetical protein [Magnetospirillum sp. 15-1]